MPPQGEDDARAFYHGILNLPEVPKPPELARRGGVWFEQGALKVHLGVQEDFIPAKKAHPGFEVSDIEVLRSKLQNANYSISEREEIEGFHRFFVNDPFGNRLEFLAPLDEPIKIS